MVTPTIQQIKDYVALKGMQYVDAEEFFNFYESKGWMVGKNPMKKWRAAVSGWNSRERRKAPQDKNAPRVCKYCGRPWRGMLGNNLHCEKTPCKIKAGMTWLKPVDEIEKEIEI